MQDLADMLHGIAECIMLQLLAPACDVIPTVV